MVSEVQDVADVHNCEIEVHVEVIDQLVQVGDVFGVNTQAKWIRNTLLFVWHLAAVVNEFICLIIIDLIYCHTFFPISCPHFRHS